MTRKLGTTYETTLSDTQAARDLIPKGKVASESYHLSGFPSRGNFCAAVKGGEPKQPGNLAELRGTQSSGFAEAKEMWALERSPTIH